MMKECYELTTKTNLEAVAKLVNSGTMSLIEAAETFNLQMKALQLCVENLKAKSQKESSFFFQRQRRLFSTDEENELVKYLQQLSKTIPGLSSSDMNFLAYKYAKANCISVPKKWHDDEKASKDWLIGFLKRNPVLKITTKTRNLLRKKPFSDFFNDLSNLFETEKAEARNQVFSVINVSENNCSEEYVDHNKMVKKDEATFGPIMKTLVTIVYVHSSNRGLVEPPTLLFPRKYFRVHFATHDSPGCVLGTENPGGWVKNEDFLQFMKIKLRHTNCSKDHPYEHLFFVPHY